MLRKILTLAAFIMVPSAAIAGHDSAPAGKTGGLPPLQAEARFTDTEGHEVGMAVLRETVNGMLIHLHLQGLPPGKHAFHIHEKGLCTPADSFTDAGGHLGGGEAAHGLMAQGGPHAGDMPNIFVNKDGWLRLDTVNERVTLDAGKVQDGKVLLNDEDGAAFIIHAGADDYHSQPTGDAGGRIACAVITPPAGD